MPVTKSAQVDEIIKCGKDPVHFINKWTKITHPEKGLIKFNTYPFQDQCVKHFVKNRFNIVLKSRQLGLSTVTAAFSLWRAIFYKEKNVLVIATKMATAANFVRKVKTMLASLPKWLVIPEITSETKTSVEFSNGSIIKAVPTSEDAGRSEALSLLIIDEAAFIRNFEELWKGLYPTLSTGGSAIILSTPNGVGNQYHKLWVDAETGISDFNPIKLTWDVHPDRDQEWYEKEARQMSKKQISQELLCDFASSGDTFLNAEDLERIRISSRGPVEKWGPSNGVWVWKYPLPNHKYIVSADVSRGDAGDYSAFHVIDTDESEQVCEFKGKIPPDQFGVLLSEVGHRYNKALVCPENNTYGYATITKLRDIGYTNIYLNDRRYQHAVDVPVAKFGFTTSGPSRSAAFTKLEEYLRTGALKVYSPRLVEELRTFVWYGNTPRAQKGFNDDLVMSLAIGGTLFEPSNSSNKKISDIHKSMLAGFGVNKLVGQRSAYPIPTKNPFSPQMYDERLHEDSQNQGNSLPSSIAWLYK
jgi:hypothetical protein